MECPCSSPGETLDTTWFDTVLDKVVGIVVDGALLQAARYMKAGRFRNIIIIMRDPAHIIRTSCRDPLHDAEVFGEQYDRLFGQRHAVLKDFINSGVWQDQLEACRNNYKSPVHRRPAYRVCYGTWISSNLGSRVL